MAEKRVEKRGKRPYSALLLWLLLAAPGTALAGGSISYEDVRGRFPDQALMFETLELALDFKDPGSAEIRVMWNNHHKKVSEKFAGARLGPYSFCARQKGGEKRRVQVTMTAETQFLDAAGRETKNGLWDKATNSIRERLAGVMIEKAEPGGACAEEAFSQ